MIVSNFGGKEVFNGSGAITPITLATFSGTSTNTHTISGSSNYRYWFPFTSHSFIMPNAYALKIIINSLSWVGTIKDRSTSQEYAAEMDLYFYITTTNFTESGSSSALTTDPIDYSNYLIGFELQKIYRRPSGGSDEVDISTITPANIGSDFVCYNMVGLESDFTTCKRYNINYISYTNVINYMTIDNTYYLTPLVRQHGGSDGAIITNAKLTYDISIQYVLA